MISVGKMVCGRIGKSTRNGLRDNNQNCVPKISLFISRHTRRECIPKKNHEGAQYSKSPESQRNKQTFKNASHIITNPIIFNLWNITKVIIKVIKCFTK